MKKLLIGVLCVIAFSFVTTTSINLAAHEDKPEITSIKPGFKAL